MKKIIYLSAPDVYAKNIIKQLESLPGGNELRIVENFNAFLANKMASDADMIVIDETIRKDASIPAIIKEIRKTALSVPIVIATLMSDFKLVNSISDDNVHFILKLDNNTELFTSLLSDKTTFTAPTSTGRKNKKGKYKVLVVDDFENTRYIVKFTLEKLGYLVSTAADGLEALQVVQQEPDTDLIILDLNMPRMDGFKFVEELRKKHLFENKPIIILTTEISADKRQRAKELKITGWVKKPYQIDEFISIVKKALGQS